MLCIHFIHVAHGACFSGVTLDPALQSQMHDTQGLLLNPLKELLEVSYVAYLSPVS